MHTKRKVELDETTAKSLETLAAERGVTVSDLVRELLDRDAEPLHASAEDLAELDRRWAAIEAGQKTVPHEEVVHWLRTWGTPSFQPWHKR